MLKTCAIYWNYQGFLSAWGNLLSFSMPGGTEKIAGLWFAREYQYPGWHYTHCREEISASHIGATNFKTLKVKMYTFPILIFRRSTLVGQHPIKSLLFVCPSVRLSLSFLKFGSLVFSDIVLDDSWPWYLVSDGARFLGKKNRPEFRSNGQKWDPRLGFFCYFLKFGSLVFFEIEYNHSLQQCLTSSRGKIHKIFLGPKFGPKRPKIRYKISFFAIFSSLIR